nr:hydrogenase formation protein HypD [Candidatus Njordarchaeum guaymaensis]
MGTGENATKASQKFRDRKTADKIVERIKGLDFKIQIMHVCGTHQDTIVKYGLDSLLEECGVTVRQGPGCPVCVTTQREIEEGIRLAETGKIVATYGDMVRVPAEKKSLADIRASGGNVHIVYSIQDAVLLAQRSKNEVVFIAVGFETTAPSTAVTLLGEPPSNFSILTCHRYVPPALHALLEMGEVKIQGLIEPGHVSTIIGLKPYEELSVEYNVPQVVSGFEPLDVLMSVYMLAKQIKNGEAKVENEYSRIVKYDGNPRALKALREVFEPYDLKWRGFPVILGSGMLLRKKFEKYDARKIFQDELEDISQREFEEPEGCKCSEVLRGLIESTECPLFGKACTPQHPVGPCMVSIEGACSILYKYYGKGRKKA